MDPLALLEGSPEEEEEDAFTISSKPGNSSDALTFVLMQEKEKVKAKRGDVEDSSHLKKIGSILRSRSKARKRTFENNRRKKQSLLGQNLHEVSAVTRSLSSPDTMSKRYLVSCASGTSASTNSIHSGSADEEMAEELERVLEKELALKRRKPFAKVLTKPIVKTGANLMKSILRRKKSGQRNTNDKESEIYSIQSGDTTTIRHRNTGTKRTSKNDIDKEDPVTMRKRASRYKKRAMKLMRDINISEEDGNNNHRSNKNKKNSMKRDSKTVESTARKAYKYATEARRLTDVALVREESNRTEPMSSYPVNSPPRLSRNLNFSASELSFSELSGMTHSSSSSPDRQKAAFRNRVSSNELCHMNSFIRISSIREEGPCSGSVVSHHTTFSQEVEIDEHIRKMKEIQLFAKNDIMKAKFNCGEVNLSPEYKAETERIIETFPPKSTDDSDVLSVLTPMTTQTQETTASELEVREKHESLMKELELFSPTSVWENVLQTFSLGSLKEKPVVKKEESSGKNNKINTNTKKTITVANTNKAELKAREKRTANTKAKPSSKSKSNKKQEQEKQQKQKQQQQKLQQQKLQQQKLQQQKQQEKKLQQQKQRQQKLQQQQQTSYKIRRTVTKTTVSVMSGDDADDECSELNSRVKAKDVITVVESIREERPRGRSSSNKNGLDKLKKVQQQKQQQEDDTDVDSYHLGQVCTSMPLSNCSMDQFDGGYLSRLQQNYISSDDDTSDSDSSSSESSDSDCSEEEDEDNDESDSSYLSSEEDDEDTIETPHLNVLSRWIKAS